MPFISHMPTTGLTVVFVEYSGTHKMCGVSVYATDERIFLFQIMITLIDHHKILYLFY